MIKAAAWKNFVNEKHFYLLQFESGSTKEVDLIFETLRGWDQTGFGFTKKGVERYIFKKEFENTDGWLSWVRNSPFIVNEIDKDGKQNRLKTAAIIGPNKQGNKNSGRVCRVCFHPGHNSATCAANKNSKVRNELTSKPISSKVKRKNKCAACGELGHNRATCSMNNKLE